MSSAKHQPDMSRMFERGLIREASEKGRDITSPASMPLGSTALNEFTSPKDLAGLSKLTSTLTLLERDDSPSDTPSIITVGPPPPPPPYNETPGAPPPKPPSQTTAFSSYTYLTTGTFSSLASFTTDSTTLASSPSSISTSSTSTSLSSSPTTIPTTTVPTTEASSASTSSATSQTVVTTTVTTKSVSVSISVSTVSCCSSPTMSSSGNNGDSSSGSSDDGNNTLVIALSTVLSVIGVVLVVAAAYWCARRRRSSVFNRGVTPIGDDEIAAWRTRKAEEKFPDKYTRRPVHTPNASTSTKKSVIQYQSAGRISSEAAAATAASPRSFINGGYSLDMPRSPDAAVLAVAPNARSGLTDETVPGDDPFLRSPKRQPQRLYKLPSNPASTQQRPRGSRSSSMRSFADPWHGSMEGARNIESRSSDTIQRPTGGHSRIYSSSSIPPQLSPPLLSSGDGEIFTGLSPPPSRRSDTYSRNSAMIGQALG